MIDHLMTIFAVLESIVILVLAEPVLNRMSPCARSPCDCLCMRSRWAAQYACSTWRTDTPELVIAAAGRRIRALLLCHQIGNLWCGIGGKNRATIAARRTLLEDDARTSGL